MERKIIDFKSYENMLEDKFFNLRISNDLSERWIWEDFENLLKMGRNKKYFIYLLKDDKIIGRYKTLEEATEENKDVPVYVYDETIRDIKPLEKDKIKNGLSDVEIVDELLQINERLLDNVKIMNERVNEFTYCCSKISKLIDDIQKGYVNDGQNDKG